MRCGTVQPVQNRLSARLFCSVRTVEEIHRAMNVVRPTIVVALILVVCGCRTFPFESAADRTAAFNSNRIPDVDKAAGEAPGVDDDQPASSWTERTASTGSLSDDAGSLAELIQRGNSEAAQGQFEEAKRYYRRVLQLEPNHPMAHHRLAVIADNQRDFPTAEHHYRIAVEADPNNPNLLNDVGYSYLLQGRYDQSERFLQEALRVDPGLTRAMKNLGLLYGSMGDYDRALAAFRRAGSDQQAQNYLAEMFPQRAARGTPLVHPAAGQPGNNWNADSNSTGELPQQRLQGAWNEYTAGPPETSSMSAVGLTGYDTADQLSRYSANRPQPPAAAWTTERADQHRPVVIQPGNSWAVPSGVGSSRRPSPSHGPPTNEPPPEQPWQQSAASPMAPQSPSRVTAGPQSFAAGNTRQPSHGDVEQYRPASVPRGPIGQEFSQTDGLGPAGIHATGSDMRINSAQPGYQQPDRHAGAGSLSAPLHNSYNNQAQYPPVQNAIQQQNWAQRRAVGFQRQRIEPAAFSGTRPPNEQVVSSPHEMGRGNDEARRTAAIMGMDVGPGSPFPVSNGSLEGVRYSANAAGRLSDPMDSADAGHYGRQHEINIHSGPNHHPHPPAPLNRAGTPAGTASPRQYEPLSPAAEQPRSPSTGQRPTIYPGLVGPQQSQSRIAWPHNTSNHSTPSARPDVQTAPANNGRWPVQQPTPATGPYPSTQMPPHGRPPAGWSAQQPISSSTSIPLWPSAPRQN